MLLNGSQTLVLLAELPAHALEPNWGCSTAKQYVVKTIVTSQMANAVADRFGVKCYDCLTGFKYIAKIIPRERGQDQVHRRRRGVVRLPRGRLRARDKDGVSACSLAAEAAAWAMDTMGLTLYEWLQELYVQYGLYREGLLPIVRKGQGGRRADPAHDGRLPGYPARRHSRLARGADQRLPDARNARHPQRRTHAHRAGPQQRIAVVHRGRHDRVGASVGHRAEDQVLLRRESPWRRPRSTNARWPASTPRSRRSRKT